MATETQCSRRAIITKHEKLIQKLEITYLNRVNQLLQQKVCLHQKIQRMLYTELEQLKNTKESTTEINTITDVCNMDQDDIVLRDIVHITTNDSNDDEHNNTLKTLLCNTTLSLCTQTQSDTNGTKQSTGSNMFASDYCGPHSVTSVEDKDEKNVSRSSHINNISMNAKPKKRYVFNRMRLATKSDDKRAAEKLKIEGNQLLTQKKYNEAIAKYTDAIRLNKTNAVYFSNRAAAKTYLKQYHGAIIDAEMASSIDPNYAKAYVRQAFAEYQLNNYQRARDAYAKALGLIHPTNKTYNYNLYEKQIKLCQQKLDAAQTTLMPQKSPIQREKCIPKRSKQSANHSVESVQCGICFRVLRNAKNLKVHYINIHTPNHQKPFRCNLCPHGTSSKSALDRHMKTHQNKYRKLFHCTQCDKTFKRKGNLMTHMKTHALVTDDKPFKCSQCQHGAKTPKALKLHQLIHAGEKPFCCDVCCKQFAHWNDLRKHIATHKQYA